MKAIVDIVSLIHWAWAIGEALKKNKVDLRVMSYKEVINFKSKDAFPQYIDVLKDTVKCSLDSRKKPTKVMWFLMKQVKFVKEKPDQIFFKYDYDDDYIEAIFKIK